MGRRASRGLLPLALVPALRRLAVVVVVAVACLSSLFLYARTWPPLAIIESGSMQHSNQTSYIGVGDTGDLVLVRATPRPGDVVTYVEGRARGYGTYGDHGDVVLYRSPTSGMRIIHRPMFRMVWNETAGGFDIPSLLALPRGVAWNVSQSQPLALKAGDNVTLHDVGFRALTVRFFIRAFVHEVVADRCTTENPCYVTMGDYNAPGYDPALIRHSWLLGRARGEVPWLGLLKLFIVGTYEWGDPRVPGNSWTSLLTLLVLLIVVPVVGDVIWLLRRRRQGPEETRGSGGLDEVVATLEERWKERDEKEGGGQDSAPSSKLQDRRKRG